LAKVVPAKVRNALVIFATSPDDLFLAPPRYGLKMAAWFGRLLSRTVGGRGRLTPGTHPSSVPTA